VYSVSSKHDSYLELELDSTVIGGDGLKKLATPVIGFCV
jgi:hypothetical protein